MNDAPRTNRFRCWLWLIRFVGLIVPRRLRADWRQEWEAELQHREAMLAEWDRLDWRHKLNLLWRSTSAFWDALWLQPRRLEDEMFQDLRFGIRLLLKNPGFTAVAVLSLALGIGANTAIFSLLDAVLLKQLPVKSPEQLVALDSFNQRGERRNFSHPVFEQLRARTSVFSGLFAAVDGTTRMELAGPESSGQTEQAEVQLVSGEYFQVLGVDAVAGRILTPADDQTPGAHPVAVLSYGFWQRRFAGDVAVIGRSITLKGQPFNVIGVTPPAFFGEAVGRAPDIWAPLMMEPPLGRGVTYLSNANVGWLRIMARLKPGVSEQQAQAALTLSLAQLKTESSDVGQAARHLTRIEVFPGRQGLPEFRDQFTKPLRILMAVVGLVLLIACANVANLLLARATARQKEVAVRLAIGAGRFRLIRQFLTESLLLSAAGGALGLLFAWWGSRVLLILGSSGAAPLPINVEPNARILGFTLAVSLLTALLFGLAPAFIVTRQEVSSALKATALVRPRLSLSRPLVVAQVALSLLLLTGAGLFVQTLRNLRTLDLGFAAEQIVQARINPQVSGYKPEQLPELYRQLLERLNAAPGVRSATLAASGFRTGRSRTCCIAVEGYTHRPNEDREIQIISVMPGYFQTLGLPLLAGRDFTPSEAGNSKPGEFPKLAVINETMARYYFGQERPLGRRFGWGDKEVKYDTEIVGVVKDANYGNLRDKTRPLIYFPDQGSGLIVVRAAADSTALLPTIRQAIQAVDKNLEIGSIRTVPQLLEQALVQERLMAKLSGFFSLLALLLACIGLYGVMSYDVARRTHEIGIRMALGARGADVLRMILRETLWLVVIGLALGLAAASAATKLVEGLLFGLEATDTLTMALAALLLLAVATLAGWLPARRAARVDPMAALRHE
jgi:predicted permease